MNLRLLLEMSEPLALIMLPGFMGHENDFHELISYFPSSIRPVLFHAPSPSGEQQRFQCSLKLWLDSNWNKFPESFILMGYSMGGRIGMGLAEVFRERWPSKLRGVIIESAHPGLLNSKEVLARRISDQQWLWRFEHCNLTEVLQAWYNQPIFQSLNQEQKNFLIESKNGLSAECMANQLKTWSLANQPSYWELFNSSPLSIPSLYISGEQDEKFTKIGRSFKGVEHAVIKNSGHNVHFENPKAFAKRVLEFIDQRVLNV